MEENAAATAAPRAAAAYPAGVTTQRHDMTNFSDADAGKKYEDVLGNIAEFLPTTTLLLFASAFPFLAKLLVQASDNKAASANGWKIIIDPTADADDDADPEMPPLLASTSTPLTLAQRTTDLMIHRMLLKVGNFSSKPIKVIIMRGCVNVDGTGLELLRKLNLNQVEVMDFGCFIINHRGGIFSNVISIIIDAVIRSRKLKYLCLPPEWFAVAVLRTEHGRVEPLKCVGSCCSIRQNWASCGREWCHVCGSGPYCDSGAALVVCKATGVKFCKERCARGRGVNAAAAAVPCPDTDCDEWYCICGCNDDKRETCIDCGMDRYCCIEECGYCNNFSCFSCIEEEHGLGACMRVCERCDGDFHKNEVQFCEFRRYQLCLPCFDDHRDWSAVEFVNHRARWQNQEE